MLIKSENTENNMIKKCLILIIVGLLCNFMIVAGSPVRSSARVKPADKAADSKKTIAKIGTGTKSKVTITLLDGKKIKGYVSKIDDASFVVTHEDTGANTEITYDKVKQISRRGVGLGSAILLGALAAAGATVLVLFLVMGSSEPGR
jgi:hypothetical protein